MMSFKYVVALLILCALASTFVESYSIPQELQLHARTNYQDILNQLCGGFNFTHPLANSTTTGKKVTLTIEDGETVKCVWKKNSDAEVSKVTACELFTEEGLIGTLWNKGTKFNHASAEAHVVMKVPKSEEKHLPKKYFLRGWGNTKNGPQCTCYSAVILVTKKKGKRKIN